MADDDFCVHTLMQQVRDVVESSPDDARETSASDQFQSGVLDLMTDLLHDAPLPEALEGGVAVLWIASQRLEALADMGLIDGNGLEVGKLALAEVMTTLAMSYTEPVSTPSARELEELFSVDPAGASRG